MSDLSRRTFLAGSAAAAAGVALAGPFEGFVAHAGRPGGGGVSPGYGPIAGVPDLRDGVVRLELPAGFQYRSFHPRGTVLADGSVLPGRHDGMAAFAGPNGTTVLVRNHEINAPGPLLGVDGPVYDPLTQGGTVTVQVDGQGNVLDDYTSLRGTQMNCAGGTHAVGHVDQLRGDRQRRRRRSRLHRRAEHRDARSTATSSRCRPTVARRRCRSGRPVGSPTRRRRCRATGGTCTSPRTTSTSPPGSTGTRRRDRRSRRADSRTVAGSRC